MDMHLKEEYLRLWSKYFNEAPLPLAFYYTDELVEAETKVKCITAAMSIVRKGRTVVLSADSVGCFGGKIQLGFAEQDFTAFSEKYPYSYLEYFLADGIPDIIEGERFKESPSICREMFLMPEYKIFTAPARYCVFKRFDQLTAEDKPEVIIFFANPDVLSGLYNLVNFHTANPNAVIAPWGAGCDNIVTAPYREIKSSEPKAIMGMFDTSPRPFVQKDEITLAVPLSIFVKMVANMDNSFLITKSWSAVQKRI